MATCAVTSRAKEKRFAIGLQLDRSRPGWNIKCCTNFLNFVIIPVTHVHARQTSLLAPALPLRRHIRKRAPRFLSRQPPKLVLSINCYMDMLSVYASADQSSQARARSC